MTNAEMVKTLERQEEFIEEWGSGSEDLVKVFRALKENENKHEEKHDYIELQCPLIGKSVLISISNNQFIIDSSILTPSQYQEIMMDMFANAGRELAKEFIKWNSQKASLANE